MEYISDLYWFEENGVHDFNGEGLNANYIIMPSSGIHDKNGKEIYQGDVVLTQKYYDRPYSEKRKGKRYIGLVEYQISGASGFYNPDSGKWDKYKEYGARWKVKEIQNRGKYVHGSWGDFFNCEVIGNIYENPELLNCSIETTSYKDKSGLMPAT